MSNIPSLEVLEADTIAEVSPINNNFEELRVAVNDNDSRISNLRTETSASISSLNTLVDNTKTEIQTKLDAKANKDLSNVESDVISTWTNYVFPKWDAKINRSANTEYQAETAGFVYIATNEGDGKSYNNWSFSISADGTTWIEIPVKTICPDTGRDNRTAFFPIPKGYYYKTPSRSFSAYYFIPTIGG